MKSPVAELIGHMGSLLDSNIAVFSAVGTFEVLVN
jgi:hypothetical protein